jgi:hypothetical protein
MEQKMYLDDDDAAVRSYALMAAGVMDLKVFLPVMEELRKDTETVKIYREGEFVHCTVAEIANKVCAGMTGRES